MAAALVLLIGMGFGRFAFTGLYPLMVADHQISVEGGSYAASANYAGYLIGALLAALLSGVSRRKLCAFSVLATVANLALLGLALPEWLIVVIRGVAGVSTAFAMVAASNWLIHDLRNPRGAPALFAGVGVGIFVSAEIIALGHGLGFSSESVWLALALIALALCVVTIALQIHVERVAPAPASPDAAEDMSAWFGAIRLILVYGLAGFGYIVTATYLPLLVHSALASVDPAHIWAVFGLGAVVSCFFWHALHIRWGTARALMANLLVQAIGVALPVLHAPTAYLLSAILVGGTFTGTVTIAMPAARRVAGTTRFDMVSIMTASYGVGQIVGPLMAGALYARTRSFDASLVIAACALVVAAGLCLGSRRRAMA
jgi:predicted MFS family arabinose efflux permease